MGLLGRHVKVGSICIIVHSLSVCIIVHGILNVLKMVCYVCHSHVNGHAISATAVHSIFVESSCGRFVGRIIGCQKYSISAFGYYTVGRILLCPSPLELVRWIIEDHHDDDVCLSVCIFVYIV